MKNTFHIQLNKESNKMPDTNPFMEIAKIVEEKGYWCASLISGLYGMSIEQQKQTLRQDLPFKILLTLLNDKDSMQDIKAAIRIFPDLRPEMAAIISDLKNDKVFKNFKNMTSERSKKLKRIVNELNELLSIKD